MIKQRGHSGGQSNHTPYILSPKPSSNYTDDVHKWKKVKHPYRSAEDFRLKICMLFHGFQDTTTMNLLPTVA